MTTVVLDTHVLHWVTAEPERLSRPARHAVREADEVAIASISWYEMAWLITHGRIFISRPLLSYLEGLANQVRTIPTSPAIAVSAAALPVSFPQDPADRVIYATALEYGWPLVTKDERMRSYRDVKPVTIW